MIENHKVSILVPVYNAAEFLEECLMSISKQTYKNSEIVIVNDGSLDDSLTICEYFMSIDGRFQIINQENQGINRTRGKLLSMVTGDFFTFVDADDFLETNAIETMVSLAMNHDADIVNCGFNTVNLKSLLIQSCPNDFKLYSNLEYMTYLLEEGKWALWASLTKTSLLKDLNDGVFDKSIKVGEDLIINALLARNAKKAVVSNEIVYNYRKGGSTAMSNPKRDEFLAHQFLAIYHTFKLLENREEYKILVGNLIIPAIYKYVFSFKKNVFKNELSEMKTFLNKINYNPKGGQMKLMLHLLNYNYYVGHLTALAFQKMKPTIQNFNSEI